MDPDEDLSDELLALAGESTNRKNKRKASSSKHSSSKRRRQQASESDNEPESEEDEVTYPLEGKYIDEADREWLLGLTETKREEILSQRLEQREAGLDRKNLDRFYQSQQAGGRGERGDHESVFKAAKRKHTALGSTREKSSKLEELKQKRKDRASRPARRSESASPQPKRRSETSSSSSEDEEGQIQQRHDDGPPGDTARPVSEALTRNDLETVRISRTSLEKFCMNQWFEDYIKGGWIRVAVGDDGGGVMKYRIGEVTDVVAAPEPYTLGTKSVKQLLEVKHGKVSRSFRMDEVSTKEFTDREFDRIVAIHKVDKLKLPTRGKMEKKAEQMRKFEARTYTEADIAFALEQQQKINNQKTEKQYLNEKSRLRQALTLAQRRGIPQEAESLQKQLAELDLKFGHLSGASTGSTSAVAGTPSTTSQSAKTRDTKDNLAIINERNRRSNLESIRKTEFEAMMRKRREMNGGGTEPVKIDLSARVKTVPKLRHDSRAGTPAKSLEAGSAQDASAADGQDSPNPDGLLSRGIDTLALSVQLDLGDF